MCGIVGLISKQPQGFYGSHADIFTDMLIMDQVRGMDGTGVFGVYRNKQAYLTKVGTHASNLVQLKAYDSFRSKMIKSMTMVFGHNRKATVGNISSANSHPFMEDNIILIHNGFISNAREFNASAPVDSQALARGLNAATPLEVVRKIQGAYALVWYDKRDKTLRIARNMERPLFMADTENFIAFASEPWMITGSLAKSRRNTDVKIHDVAEIKPHVLYEFTGTGEFKTTSYFPAANYANHGNNRWAGFHGGYAEYDEPVVIKAPYVQKPVDRPSHAPVIPGPVSSAGRGLFDVWNEILSTLPALGEDIAFSVRRISFKDVLGKSTVSVEGALTIEGHSIDVNGLVDWTNSIQEVNQCILRANQQSWLTGEIAARGVTTSGPWIRVNNIFAPSMVTTWNKIDVPQFLWERVVKSHKCNKCGGPIVSKESGFTSVKLDKAGDIARVVCSKCVMQGLERDENEKASDSSVQVGQPVSQIALH